MVVVTEDENEGREQEEGEGGELEIEVEKKKSNQSLDEFKNKKRSPEKKLKSEPIKMVKSDQKSKQL